MLCSAARFFAEEVLVRVWDYCGAHEVHPDGEGGTGAGFLVAEGFVVVVADPDAAGDGRRKADEPGVGKVAGGAGFAA